MRKMKIFIAILLVLALFPVSGVQAAQNEIKVLHNGNVLKFPNAKPYTDENNRTMVPIRLISENLGAKVTWNKKNQQVGIALEDKEITLTIGEKAAVINGEKIELDTAAVTHKNRTFVPLRFVGEALDMKVGWDGRSRTVFIDDPAYLEAIDHYINEVLETKEEKERILEELRQLPVETEDGSTFKEFNDKLKNGREYWVRMLPEVAKTAEGYLNARFNFDYRAADEAYRLNLLQYHAAYYQYKGERLAPDVYIDSLIEDQKKDKVIVEQVVITDPSMVYVDKYINTMVRCRVFTRYKSHDNLPSDYTFNKWYVQDIDLKLNKPITNAKINWNTTEYSYAALYPLNDPKLVLQR